MSPATNAVRLRFPSPIAIVGAQLVKTAFSNTVEATSRPNSACAVGIVEECEGGSPTQRILVSATQTKKIPL